MHNSCSDAKQARWMARGQLPQLAACETAGEADFFPNLKPAPDEARAVSCNSRACGCF
eukprot:CAMPEP_0195627270 /NCGR_PEP_ID=MMETSP0815-20121206/18823_1 /TAXON_ID=97485 /ORGANISM="Prymnesium parvum, Strain Texoma1" /LENGTH=57 /DNA_ID=CAMNT_0040768455 /DNA_START=276 /DNA_END=446 /DNA_ORIENTATION=+